MTTEGLEPQPESCSCRLLHGNTGRLPIFSGGGNDQRREFGYQWTEARRCALRTIMPIRREIIELPLNRKSRTNCWQFSGLGSTRMSGKKGQDFRLSFLRAETNL